MSTQEERRAMLESMQIKGIRWMIWQHIGEEKAEERLLNITNQSTIADIRKFVDSQNRETLIKLIEISPEISPKTIETAYDKYRYGLRPGFTLFWVKRKDRVQLTKDELETRINTYFDAIKYGESAKLKGLKLKTIMKFSDIYEVSMTYLQKYNYIDEEGEFKYVYCLKECFAWIGIERNFVAINNMPDVLMNHLKHLFSSLYHSDITNIKITNKLLDQVFSREKTKRVTKHNSNPPDNQLEKVTFSDSKLSEKMDAIPEGYDLYDTTSTQYTEEIDGALVGTLGVNCDKGKMYLSKNLTSSQFRTWSLKRINDIIGYFQSSTDISSETIKGYNMFSSSEWRDLKPTVIPVMNEIAIAVINCKKTNTDIYPLSFDTYHLYQELSRYFIERLRLICETCNERAVPHCTKCDESSFSVTKKAPAKIMCSCCGDSQQGIFDFQCEQGHLMSVSNVGDALELISNDDFSEKLFSTIKTYFPDLTFAKGEYIIVTQSGLEFHCSPNYDKLNPSDIDEFRMIAEHSSIKSENELLACLKSVKEKCQNATNDNCAHCKTKQYEKLSDVECILQLFAQFEGYSPQPHQGHEFGDVSMNVKCHGETMTFMGIAKSVITGKSKKITLSSNIGREIIQQALTAFYDARVDIVGVIYPDLIDDQLKYFLCHYAKLSNKRFVLLDRDFMIKLLDSCIC